MNIDSTKCTGCGYCVDVCPQKAIVMRDNLAVIKKALCTQCGTCAIACPVGAIREPVPANTKLSKGGESMTYGYGRGFGFRGSSPPWPYIGRGRGGLPRCWHPGLWGGTAPYTAPGATPYYGPEPASGEELGFLKNEASIMKQQLEDIESRIRDLEKEKA
jgi:NAD-dependent dihydropyrimidine dehydrogenase PreA subunit